MDVQIPESYRFTDDHEWADRDGDDIVTVGISHHAQDALGDIVFIEFPLVGEQTEQGEPFGVVESVKTVSDLYAPVTGEVVEINDELETAPELVNESPYDEGWLVRIEMDDPSEFDELMDVDSYESFLKDGD